MSPRRLLTASTTTPAHFTILFLSTPRKDATLTPALATNLLPYFSIPTGLLALSTLVPDVVQLPLHKQLFSDATGSFAPEHPAKLFRAGSTYPPRD